VSHSSWSFRHSPPLLQPAGQIGSGWQAPPPPQPVVQEQELAQSTPPVQAPTLLQSMVHGPAPQASGPGQALFA
jgi:hypothetical protein